MPGGAVCQNKHGKIYNYQPTVVGKHHRRRVLIKYSRRLTRDASQVLTNVLRPKPNSLGMDGPTDEALGRTDKINFFWKRWFWRDDFRQRIVLILVPKNLTGTEEWWLRREKTPRKGVSIRFNYCTNLQRAPPHVSRGRLMMLIPIPGWDKPIRPHHHHHHHHGEMTVRWSNSTSVTTKNHQMSIKVAQKWFH